MGAHNGQTGIITEMLAIMKRNEVKLLDWCALAMTRRPTLFVWRELPGHKLQPSDTKELLALYRFFRAYLPKRQEMRKKKLRIRLAISKVRF